MIVVGYQGVWVFCMGVGELCGPVIWVIMGDCGRLPRCVGVLYGGLGGELGGQ